MLGVELSVKDGVHDGTDRGRWWTWECLLGLVPPRVVSSASSAATTKVSSSTPASTVRLILRHDERMSALFAGLHRRRRERIIYSPAKHVWRTLEREATGFVPDWHSARAQIGRLQPCHNIHATSWRQEGLSLLQKSRQR